MISTTSITSMSPSTLPSSENSAGVSPFFLEEPLTVRPVCSLGDVIDELVVQSCTYPDPGHGDKLP